MSILATLDQQIRAAQSGSPGPAADFWYQPIGEDSDSGIRINSETAMRITTVYKCARWRGEQFAKLPKKLFERIVMMERSGRKEAHNHRLFPLIHKSPNPVMPSFAFFEFLSRDLDLEGNFYAFIQRDDFFRVRALWRLRPDRCTPKPVQVADASQPTGKRTDVIYEVTDDNGIPYKFFSDEILHVPGLGFDGIRGYNPIQMNMQLLGWHRAAQRNSATFYKKGSRPSMIINAETPIKDPKVKQELISSLSQNGRDSGAIALIEGGVKVHKWSIDPDEAQHLETMQYTEEGICGFMMTPPHKVGILRNMNNSIAEQQNIGAVTDSIQPLCERVEQWFDFRLLSDAPSTGIGGGTERDRFYMECELKGMMRGDTAARSAFYTAMRNIGVMSTNDIREEENMPPVEGGDIYVLNSAFATIQRIEDGTAVRSGTQTPDDPNDAQRQDTQKKNSGSAHMRAVFQPIFQDAVGRVMNKKRPEDRESSAAKTFFSLFVGVVKAHEWEANTDFVSDYLGALAKRAAAWEGSAEDIAADELDRAVIAIILKKGLNNA